MVDSVVAIEAWLLFSIFMLLMLYMMVDVAYFTRMTVVVLRAKYFKKKVCLMEKLSFTSWCFLNDIDTLLFHMNNARYIRELDFARADFYERTGLYQNARGYGGGIVQAATTIRYRRFIKPCNHFAITSRVVYWDEKTIFMEHEFVSKDGFVNAVAICRQRIIKSNAGAIIEKLVKANCTKDCQKCGIKTPPIPPDVMAWIESNEISSQKLRADIDVNKTTSKPVGSAINGQERNEIENKYNGNLVMSSNKLSLRKNATSEQTNENVHVQADTSAKSDNDHCKRF